MYVIKTVAVLLALQLLSVQAPAFEGTLRDGTYEGEHSFVKVEVTVAGGKVTEIDLVRHGGGGDTYAAMVEPLTGSMVEAQTTSVDTVTGATVSSNYLKKAVEKALNKARM